jgi:polysaccharide biosynthesis protein PslH
VIEMTPRKPGVVVMGPAWHSCGSHQLYKAQLEAYARMGLETYFLAVSPTAKILGLGNSYWEYYLRMTPDIVSTARGEARLGRWFNFNPSMIKDKIASLNRTICYISTLTAKYADLPKSLNEFVNGHEIKTVHCNHYFNLPIASKIRQKTPQTRIVCETQDIQSRHFVKTSPKHPFTGIQGSYEAYFSDEIRCAEVADDFVHLNQEEFDTLKAAMPHKRHHLIYPSVARRQGGTATKADIDFLIVSSANMPNYHSLCWFLDEVWDDSLNSRATLRIIGNIDYVFQSEKDTRYKKFGDIFQSRVENVSAWYDRAYTVLAPVIEGQGISIKTIEALSYGKPFLFSPMALRGFESEPVTKRLKGLCSSAEEFKKSLWLQIEQKRNIAKKNLEAENVYNSLFSPEVYQNKMTALTTG